MHRLIFAAAFLSVLGGCATFEDRKPATNSENVMMMSKHHAPHIITVKSNGNFETTLASLKAIVAERGFKTFAVIDHAKGAVSIGAELRPTTLIIFGNPKGGTPLIKAEQRLGLRLPLKMLVFENAEGAVHIAYPDIAHLFHEYGVEGLAEPRSKIESALAAIAAEAAGL